MIGQSTDSLPLQLPNQIDVLRVYFNLPKKTPESKKIATIVKLVKDRYRENAVRVKGTETIRIKIKRLVNSCKNLISKRTVCRKSVGEKRKHEKFYRNIHNLFDVAENSLVDQQPNHSFIDSFDSSSTSHESDVPSSFDEHHSEPELYSDSDHDSDPDYDPSKDAFLSHDKVPIPKSLLKEVSGSRASYRICGNLLNVGVKINGGQPNMYGMSKSTLWSKITQIRSSQKNELHASLAADTSEIVLQFDGKSCSRLNERHLGNEERLIILCHTNKGDIPLGFFALESKSGRNCSTQILRSLADHSLSHRIVGLVCDTESTNTGPQNGTCALVENALEVDLLYLMCRHHIKEIHLKDVFTAIFGTSQASYITNFDVLLDNWDHIKNTGFLYSPMDNEDLMRDEWFQDKIRETVELIGFHASSKNIRDDYAELNDLVLKFLGARTQETFKVVGARNNARWMARIIYAMKTYLFRDYLDLDEDFIVLLERFCNFVALFYTKHWNRCTNAVDAPYNDLQLWKELDEYKTVDEEIVTAALAAHKRHLWYLSDELAVLSLFSNKVSINDKADMATKMTQNVGDRTCNSIKYTSEIDDIQNIQLHHFISARSFFLFELLQLNAEFLDENPANWNEMNSFKLAKQKILDLITVVNDSAERAVQLGANTITNQRAKTEQSLQEFIISTYGENLFHQTFYGFHL